MSVRWNDGERVPDGLDAVVFGAVLRLRSVRHLPRFLRWNRGIQRQLATSDGLVRYALRAKFRTLEFEALSLWVDDTAIASFARSGVHASGAGDLRRAGAMSSTEFLTWNHRAGDHWPTWEDLAMRLGADDRATGSPVAHACAPGLRDSR